MALTLPCFTFLCQNQEESLFLKLPGLATRTTKKSGWKENEGGVALMILMVRMKDLLLKETASEVSKQTGLSGGATGVLPAHLTTDRLRHRQP